MSTIYLLPIKTADAATPAYCAARFPKRYAKAERFRSREDRLRSIGAGILLDKVLGLREAQLSFGAYGKPRAEDCPLKFSLSHSGGYALLAVSDCELGADIEAVAPRNLSVAKKICTADEMSYLREAPETRFFELWTMKESVSKASGKGLSLPFASFSVLPLLRGDPICVEGQILYGRTLHFADSVISVCTVGRQEEVKLTELKIGEQELSE